MPTLKDDAIVLRLIDWSETSQIVVLLTREHGKVSGTAKGAKRQTPSILAKFSGGLELLSRGEAVFITKVGRDLANLIEWDLRDGYWAVRGRLRAFELAMYAVDLTHHMLHDHDPHPVTFEALAGLLTDLSSRDADDTGTDHGGDPRWGASLLRFQWAIVTDCGYQPALAGEAPTGEAMLFSATGGGVVASAADAWKVRRGTIDLLRAVEAGRPIDAAPADAVERANRLLCAYCRAILDKQLPTMDALLRPRSGRRRG